MKKNIFAKKKHIHTKIFKLLRDQLLIILIKTILKIIHVGSWFVAQAQRVGIWAKYNKFVENEGNNWALSELDNG